MAEPLYYEPFKVFHLPHGEEYHATPRCPEIAPAQRRLLEVHEELNPPDGLWQCARCCPTDLVIPRQGVYRLPVTFHADSECADFPASARVAPAEATDADWQRLEWIVWPSRTYFEIVCDDGSAWKRCRRCLPTVTTLYPLGSSERPA